MAYDKKTIFLLTSGSGAEGDEWEVISIHSSLELAELAKKYAEIPKINCFGNEYITKHSIEEWDVD